MGETNTPRKLSIEILEFTPIAQTLYRNSRFRANCANSLSKFSIPRQLRKLSIEILDVAPIAKALF
jgi:hypothetical protein